MHVANCWLRPDTKNLAHGVVQKSGIFLNDPKSPYRFYSYRFSGGELPVDKKCYFSSFFVGVILCENIPGRESTDVIFCVHFLSSPFVLHSLPFMFPSCCIHFPAFCIHCLSFCFHVLSYSVAMCQTYGPSKADMLKPVKCVSAQTLAFFNMSLSFLLSLSYRFGGLCWLPSSGFMSMSVYKYVIVLFLLSFSGPAMRWQC